jgi:sec-independent protein translocase protein TatB
MFDVSLSELMLIGVIALIVIGPERLPKVARTIGHLVGRAQRYVSDVKTDIQKEMDLDELTSLKGQMQDAAKSVKDSMSEASNSLRKPIDEAQKALKEASASVDTLIKAETAEIKSDQAKTEADTAAPGAAAAIAAATSAVAAADAAVAATAAANAAATVPSEAVAPAEPVSELVELGSAAPLIDLPPDPLALEPMPTPGTDADLTPEPVQLGSASAADAPPTPSKAST